MGTVEYEDLSLLSTNPRIPESWMRKRGKRLCQCAPNRARRGSRRDQAGAGPRGDRCRKTAFNLEGCALSCISKKPRNVEQPCPVTHRAIVADEVKKLGKME